MKSNGVKCSETAGNTAPLAASQRRGSWADSQHRPKHMRWRDKVAYVEKRGSEEIRRDARISTDSCDSATVVTVGVEASKGSWVSPQKEEGVKGTEHDTTPIAARQRRGSWADSQHRPKHMRWRDKVAYVEKHDSGKCKSDRREPRMSNDSCESTDVIPIGDEDSIRSSISQEKAQGVKVTDYNTAPIAAQQRRCSWADSQHRPKHMRWRDKVAYVEKHDGPH